MPFKRRRIIRRRPRRGYRVIRGRGDYRSFFRSVGSGLKRGAGWLWRNGGKQALMAGLPLAGSAAMKLIGAGDYKMKGKGALRGSMAYKSMVPAMHARLGAVRITHRECCQLSGYPGLADPLTPPGDAGPLYSSKIFQIQNVPNEGRQLFINAGNPLIFPWLSDIAEAFEQYSFSGLAFEYRPSSGESTAAPGAIIGVVTMSTEYDVYRPRPSTLQQQMVLQYVNQGKASTNFMHGIECAKSSLQIKRFNVRRVAEPQFADASNGDARMSWPCCTTISTQGCAVDGQPLGWLWATYDVNLFNPTIQPIANQSANSSFQQIYSFNSTFQGTVPTPFPLLAYPAAFPFGPYAQVTSLPPSLNTAGITPVYGMLLPPSNSTSPSGIVPEYLNGFQFPSFGNVQTSTWEWCLTYNGDGSPPAGGFSLGAFKTFGPCAFIQGAYSPGQVFSGDMGSTATSVMARFITVTTGAAPSGWYLDGTSGSSFPVDATVNVTCTQLPNDWPNLIGTTSVTSAGF